MRNGDIVVCNRNYIETEVARSFRRFTDENGFLVHLKQGNKYKVISIQLDRFNGDNIVVKNEFGYDYFYKVSFFNTVKELRRNKLKKLNNGYK